MDIPEIDLSDERVLTDPFTAYGEVRERTPIARIPMPGIGAVWALTRHEDARAMLGDPRFAITSGSFLRPPDIPEHCLKYMHTMSEQDGPEHARLRRLAAPAFTARRAEEFRPRIEPIVERLLDALPAQADLLAEFARPLPMEVICELVGIPAAERPQWRDAGAAVVAGTMEGFVRAVPMVVDGAQQAVRTEPGDNVLGDLLRARMSETELITLVWHLVLAGQTPTNFIANAVAALLANPEQLALLRADPALLPRAVDELIRWCGPALLTIPRYASEDVTLWGATIRKGDPVTAVVASANRDPRAFAAPDVLDVTAVRQPGHLGFGHGPHYCLGAAPARVQAEVALGALLRRFPDLELTAEPQRMPDPGTWRLAALAVSLSGSRGSGWGSAGPGAANGRPAR